MTDAELTVYTDQGDPFDSTTLQLIIWDGNAGGLRATSINWTNGQTSPGSGN